MDNWVEQFLQLPRKKRQKISLGREGYKKKKYRKQRRLTKEQVVMFLIENKNTTNTKLMKYQENPQSPGYYHIRKFFPEQYGMSAWDTARKEVFNISKAKPIPPSPMAVVKAVQYCEIKTLEDYNQYRKKDMSLFPSKHYIFKEFGSFSNLKRIVDSLNPNSIIARFISLKHQLKRWPAKKDCREHGVEIDNIKMSQEDLRWTVGMLESPIAFIQRAIR